MAEAALRYEHVFPGVPLWVRIRGRIAAWRDRSSVLRSFLTEHGARRARDINLGQLPSKTYIIRTQYLEYLADVRDAYIMREVKKARTAQERVRLKIQTAKSDYDAVQTSLQELKEGYVGVKHTLEQGTLTALDTASYQGRLGVIEEDVSAQLREVASRKSELAALIKDLTASKKEFAEFCAHVRSEYEVVVNGYIKSAGRRLNKLGVTDYDAALRNFSDETQAKIKELTDG